MSSLRRICILVLTSAAISASFGASPASAHETPTNWLKRGRLVRVWVCIQHENVVQSNPGECPTCGLRLMEQRRRLVGVAAVMPKIPAWLFYGTAVSLILLSFVVLEFWGRRRPGQRAPPIKYARLAVFDQLSRRAWFGRGARVAVFLIFTVVLVGGLSGNPDPQNKIIPVLAWALWSAWLALIATRAMGLDIIAPETGRAGEAYLALAMLAISNFHGLTLTTRWIKLIEGIEGKFGIGESVSVAVGTVGVLALPLAIYYVICLITGLISGRGENSANSLFFKFAFSLLPIALFYHLAHNTGPILYWGKSGLRAGASLFGHDSPFSRFAEMPIEGTIPIALIWGIQVALIVIGHIYGILLAHNTSSALYRGRRHAVLSQIPILVVMLLFSFHSLWLVAQPTRAPI